MRIGESVGPPKLRFGRVEVGKEGWGSLDMSVREFELYHGAALTKVPRSESQLHFG